MSESLEELDPTTLNALWYWMNERHGMYLRRQEGQPYPWTKDSVLDTYRFCNVFRELDKVTIWLRENWREPYADHPNLWFAMCMARLINLPETLGKIGFPEHGFDAERFVSVIERKRLAGEKVFTSAYMLTGNIKGGGRPKANLLADHVLGPIWELGKEHAGEMISKGKSLKFAFDYLKKFPGMGGNGFIAYEVVTDLRHTRYLRDATDLYTWANAGPGAQRGVNRLLGRQVYHNQPKPDLCLRVMQKLLEIANGENSPLAHYVPRPIEMRDIEHSLCEMDKYLRSVLGQGSPKALYSPPGQTKLSLAERAEKRKKALKGLRMLEPTQERIFDEL